MELCVIPSGLTQFAQAIDTDYAHLLRTKYNEIYAKWLHNDASQPGARFTGRQLYELMLKWLHESHRDILRSSQINYVFERLGYTSDNNIHIRGLEYQYSKSVQPFELHPEQKTCVKPAKGSQQSLFSFGFA